MIDTLVEGQELAQIAVKDKNMSGDKNMDALKVAVSGFFCFIGTNPCPETFPI